MGEWIHSPIFQGTFKVKDFYYSGMFAGKELCFAFRHPETAAYYASWLRPCEPAENAVRVPPSDCEIWIRDYGMLDDGNTEFGMSVYRASDALISSDRCVIHGAAMLWRGKAWLFVADGGTGKSTQLRLWKELYGDEVRIMNGDKPVLFFADDGAVTVHPSPWKGKEEWGDDSLSAPLGGIILLRQGSENKIVSCSPYDIAAWLLSCFFCSFDSEKTVRALCRLEEKIISAVGVWRLVNLGDADSARLTHDTLLREEEKHA